MSDKATFTLKGRNPDVLTSIANLSNDEVFTPPEFANRMLDSIAEAWALQNAGASIWADSSVKFLDPFTKSGVFLREITNRLVNGLKSEIPDLQTRVNHVLTKQVFGIAITQLTELIARRSVYCSKWANGSHSICTAFSTDKGNIWFQRLNHEWVGGTKKLLVANQSGDTEEEIVDGRCRACRAGQAEYQRGDSDENYAYALLHYENIDRLIEDAFGEIMKFDVVIGNPPYQLSDGGHSASATSIYHFFVQQAKRIDPKLLAMVIPARWYSGGKGVDEFRKEMLNDPRLRVLEDFPDSNDVFPGTQIKGGVCYFLWNRDDRGLASVRNHLGDDINIMERPLLEPGAEVFIRFNAAIPILHKVVKTANGSDSQGVKLGADNSFKELVSSSKPFGFRTFFKATATPKPGSLKIYQNGGIGYVERGQVEKGTEFIDVWKVFIPRAGSGSDSFPHSILGKPFTGEPGTVSTETYNFIGPFGSEFETQSAISYIQTRLFRFLVLLHKPSQDANRNVYSFVPFVPFDKIWSDESIYRYFGIEPHEINFIESLIRPAGADIDEN